MSREYTKVACRLFKSKKFRRLSDGDKLVYVFLLISPDGNSAGCFEQDTITAAAHLGCSEKAYLEAIDRLSHELIAYDEATDTVKIENWYTFNRLTNTRHASGALGQLEKLPDSSVKNQAFQELKRHIEIESASWSDAALKLLRAKIERLSIAYAEASALRPDQRREDHTKTKTEDARANENSECQEDGACDVTAAPLPTDGGEGGQGKSDGPSPALKALLAQQDRRGSRDRSNVHPPSPTTH